MGYRKIQIGWLLVLTTVLTLAAAASAQVTVGDNIQMGLAGDASVGWTGQYDGQDTSSLAFGFNGNLTGSYYNPKFLNWRINPYYNQSRFNSNFNSLTAAKGINATAGLFTGSNTPIEFNFQKAYDAQNLLNFPGTTGSYESRGNSTSFDVNAGVYYEDYPTLNVSFGKSVSNYEVLGTDANGSGDSRFITIGSSYTVAGFDLSGRFNGNRIGTTLSPVSGFNDQKINSSQRGFTLSANRRLLDWMRWGTTYSRTHFDTDYALNPTNATFSIVNSDLSMTPTSKLTVNVFTNYSSNLNAQIISGIVAGTQSSGSMAQPLATTELLSSYLDYGANAAYSFTHRLTATARVDRREQNYSQSNIAVTSDVFSSGISYSRDLLGGSFGVHYGFSWFDTNSGNAGVTGHSASASYTRDVLGFNTGMGAQYARNVASALTGYSQDTYSGSLNVAHRLWRGWNAGLGGSYGKSSINGLNEGRTSIETFNAVLSAPRFSISGNYSKNAGNSLPFGNGTGSLPPVIPGLILYSGTSWGAAAGFNPKRRLHITASFSHTQYHTDNINTVTNTLSDRFEIRSEYRWRQMTFNGGFAHIAQGIGVNFNNPDTLNVIYFGVSRHFDIF